MFCFKEPSRGPQGSGSAGVEVAQHRVTLGCIHLGIDKEYVGSFRAIKGRVRTKAEKTCGNQTYWCLRATGGLNRYNTP